MRTKYDAILASKAKKPPTVKTYKWEYLQDGNALICRDNGNYRKGKIQAICIDVETAHALVGIMNNSREPKQVL